MASLHCHFTKDLEQTTDLALESCHSLTNATIPLETALFAQHDLCCVVFAFFFVFVAVGLGRVLGPSPILSVVGPDVQVTVPIVLF